MFRTAKSMTGLDEMKISELGDLDRTLDVIVGLAKNVHFVMAKGLVFVHFEFRKLKSQIGLMHLNFFKKEAKPLGTFANLQN